MERTEGRHSNSADKHRMDRAKRALVLVARVRDRIEPAVGAIVLALIIRGFALEPFKIPTSSMFPTLRGDRINGDQIFVDKALYNFAEPRALDVIVFRRPEAPIGERNLIKRCVGLPGQSVAIREGDLYVDGEILRKPDSKQKSLWFRVPGAVLRGGTLPPPWNVEGRHQNDRDGMTLIGEPHSAARLVYGKSIRDEYPGTEEQTWRARGGPHLVSDIMVRCRITARGQGSLRLMLRDRNLEHEAVISVGKRGTTTIADNLGFIDSAGDIWLNQNEDHLVEFSHLDHAVSLRVAGEEVLRKEYDESHYEGRGTRLLGPPIEIAAEGCEIRFRSVEAFRDVFWLNGGHFATQESIQVPTDCYLMFGDNSPVSRDSRMWENPFVRREDLLGRALIIWWPWNRWRAIH